MAGIKTRFITAAVPPLSPVPAFPAFPSFPLHVGQQAQPRRNKRRVRLLRETDGKRIEHGVVERRVHEHAAAQSEKSRLPV